MIDGLWQCEQEQESVRDHPVWQHCEEEPTTTPVDLKKKEHLHISFWWESESDKTNFERNNTYKSLKKTIVWWDHENINTSPPKKNEPKVIRFNSNYFKLEMFLYDERPSLQRAISLHMSTTKPTWVNLLYLNIFTFLIDEKVKVKMPILDLVKYSFVVRCKDLCHIYGKYLVPLHHTVWDNIHLNYEYSSGNTDMYHNSS